MSANIRPDQMSVLTKKQTKRYGPRPVQGYGEGAMLTATVRYDDECGNGHNTFSITDAVIVGSRDVAGGCLHEDIGRVFPELHPYIKWHLVSTDGPMHYLENTMYWLGYRGYCDGKAGSPPNLAYAREIAVWPDLPESYLAPAFQNFGDSRNRCLGSNVEEALKQRLPALMVEFRAAVESLGFVY